jgi:hypothetical protein
LDTGAIDDASLVEARALAAAADSATEGATKGAAEGAVASPATLPGAEGAGGAALAALSLPASERVSAREATSMAPACEATSMAPASSSSSLRRASRRRQPRRSPSARGAAPWWELAIPPLDRGGPEREQRRARERTEADPRENRGGPEREQRRARERTEAGPRDSTRCRDQAGITEAVHAGARAGARLSLPSPSTCCGTHGSSRSRKSRTRASNGTPACAAATCRGGGRDVSS